MTVLDNFFEIANDPVKKIRPAFLYFGSIITFHQLNEYSDRLADELVHLGLQPNSNVAAFMQNIPQYPILTLALWKLGCAIVNVNPMYKHKELTHVLEDSQAMGLVCLDSLYESVARDTISKSETLKNNLKFIITTNELDFTNTFGLHQYPEIFSNSIRKSFSETKDLMAILHKDKKTDQQQTKKPPPNPTACLTYTSGTTGPSKGAQNSHENLDFVTRGTTKWMSLGDTDVILGVAPLFHITGFVKGMSLTLSSGIPTVLTFRFHPRVVASLIETYQCTYTVGSITVFISLMNDPVAPRYNISSLKKAYSGGAPVSISTIQEFEKRFGIYIHPIYGLTESTAPSHFTPLWSRAPFNSQFSVVSVGKPIPGTYSFIVDENRNVLNKAHSIGEIVITAPQCVSGYFNKPEASQKTMPKTSSLFENQNLFPSKWNSKIKAEVQNWHTLYTGDVGFVDEEGWFFVIDRIKDMIVASGYKIWPREVEEALYEHPDVKEAAVIGVPDKYRGETVKAYVSLKERSPLTPQQLVEHCKERLASFKVPKQIEIISELPKNLSGKILRRELRDTQATPPSKL